MTLLSRLLDVGVYANMVVASVLVLIIFYLVYTAVSRREPELAVTAMPLAIVTAALMISVSIYVAAKN
jgi:hypothetical protein